MRPLVNFLVIAFGILEVFSGIMKLITNSPSFKLSFGEAYLRFPCYNSIIYIILVNFIGGGLLIWYTWYTKKDRPEDTNSKKNNPINNLLAFSGIYIVAISLWEFVYAGVILASFDNQILTYLPMFIFCIIVFAPKSLLPIVLVYINSIKPKKKTKRY
jgi:hypothetical protein